MRFSEALPGVSIGLLGVQQISANFLTEKNNMHKDWSSKVRTLATLALRL